MSTLLGVFLCVHYDVKHASKSIYLYIYIFFCILSNILVHGRGFFISFLTKNLANGKTDLQCSAVWDRERLWSYVAVQSLTVVSQVSQPDLRINSLTTHFCHLKHRKWYRKKETQECDINASSFHKKHSCLLNHLLKKL